MRKRIQSEAPEEPRKILVNLGDDLIERIDTFRFDNRFPNRSEAIRWLLAFAVKQNPKRD